MIHRFKISRFLAEIDFPENYDSENTIPIAIANPGETEFRDGHDWWFTPDSPDPSEWMQEALTEVNSWIQSHA